MLSLAALHIQRFQQLIGGMHEDGPRSLQDRRRRIMQTRGTRDGAHPVSALAGASPRSSQHRWAQTWARMRCCMSQAVG